MRFRGSSIIIVIIAAIAVLAGTSCKKNKTLTTGGVLQFSVDTLKFDTVFTAAGSFTTGLLIYNPQDEAVTISTVKLQQGGNSYFHLNVDGFSGNNVTNLKIAAHDSLYVFATVNIDPNNSRTPFVVTDSLVATLNGKDYYVPFTAYGQNAHYIVDSTLTGNVVWDTILPYVIINNAFVAQGATLTINAGCRIYMHQNSGLAVFGKLLVNGTATDTVVFQGDRLDRAYFGYQGYPGEWGGLYFDSYSSGSQLTYTRIENCGNGALGNAAAIWVAPDSTSGVTTQVHMDHCIVQNSIGYGIYTYQGTMSATNCLFDATGAYALAILRGGKDTFTNCTFANYGGTSLTHSSAGTVAILNYYSADGVTYEYGDLNAVMRNCIVYGSLDSEIVCDAATNAAANLVLDHCLLKMGTVRESFIQISNCIFNNDPLFKDQQNADFHLTLGSPAIDSGVTISGMTTDLDGKPRPAGAAFDIGCYEYQP